MLAARLRFHMCTSLAPRPMTVVFGLETRLCVRMRTILENGILRMVQQPGRAVSSFIDQGEFIAIYEDINRERLSVTNLSSEK